MCHRSLVQRLVLVLLERADQQLAHAFAEISRQDCIQQWIDARVEVGRKKSEWREQCIEVGIAAVVVGPVGKIIVSMTPPSSHWLILTISPVLPHFTGMQRQIAEGER